MQFYAPDIQKPGRKEEEKDGGRKMEGWKEGGREGKKKRQEKKGRNGNELKIPQAEGMTHPLLDG